MTGKSSRAVLEKFLQDKQPEHFSTRARFVAYLVTQRNEHTPTGELARAVHENIFCAGVLTRCPTVCWALRMRNILT